MFEIQEDTWDEFSYSITCLQFARRAYEAAPDKLNSMSYLCFCMNDSFEIADGALACYCDCISPHEYHGGCFPYGCYYSSESMMEFYRLCRTHARRLHIKLCEEPFLMQAERFVYAQLGNSYTFEYTLHTKVNRQYASGIAVRFTEEFCEYEDFDMAMIDIMQFYRDETLRLKKVLASTQQIVSTPIRQEEAA